MYDKLFGNTINALNYRSKRQEIIAQNLANADTPGYKSQDLMIQSFKNALALNLSHAQHLPLSTSHQNMTIFNKSDEGNIDGNTVNVDQEMVKFTENALHYQILLQNIQQQVQQIKLALR